MNKNVLSHLISIGLFLTVLVLLVGCQLGEVEKAAASGSIPSEGKSARAIDPADRKFFDDNYGAYDAASKSLANLTNIDPADRKFFNGDYVANYAASRSLTNLSNIDPADRKFFTASSLIADVSSEVDTMATIDPADRKFFDRGYIANYVASESSPHLANIDPADRKFFDGGYLDAGSVARLVAGGNPADRDTSSGN